MEEIQEVQCPVFRCCAEEVKCREGESLMLRIRD